MIKNVARNLNFLSGNGSVNWVHSSRDILSEFVLGVGGKIGCKLGQNFRRELCKEQIAILPQFKEAYFEVERVNIFLLNSASVRLSLSIDKCLFVNS